MKVVGLLSGGKDSTYSMIKCQQYGHQIVCVANLYPAEAAGGSSCIELDSFMIQTAGYQNIGAFARCMGVPLVRYPTQGKRVAETLHYDHKQANKEDEVEDLLELLKLVKTKFPDVEAVCSGAILSNYQRLRVENVCSRLGLVSLSYLWQRDQMELLQELRQTGMKIILVKVACMGLNPNKHLGMTLNCLADEISTNSELQYMYPTGEGGEYESFVLECPQLFGERKMVIDEQKIVSLSDDPYSPVGVLQFSVKVEPDNCESETINPDHDDGEYPSPTTAAATSSPPPVSSISLGLECVAGAPPLRAVSGGDGLLVSCCGLTVKRVFGSQCMKSEYWQGLTSHYSLSPVQLALTLILQYLKQQFEKNGLSISQHVSHVVVSLVRMSDFAEANSVYKQFFGTCRPPSRAAVELGRLQEDDVSIHVDVFGWQPTGDRDIPTDSLHVQSISEWAMACIGPYSQAYTIGNLIQVAGIIGLQPATLTLPANLEEEGKYALYSLTNVLSCVKTDFDNMVMMTIYCTDWENKPLWEKQWNALLEEKRQNKQPVIVRWVQSTNLPKNAHVEYQVVCCKTPPPASTYMYDDDDDDDSNNTAPLYTKLCEETTCWSSSSCSITKTALSCSCGLLQPGWRGSVVVEQHCFTVEGYNEDCAESVAAALVEHSNKVSDQDGVWCSRVWWGLPALPGGLSVRPVGKLCCDGTNSVWVEAWRLVGPTAEPMAVQAAE
eukprot:TRINITY_DN66123_c7_g2_i1.p1 TRINITY_DN66123_c7_g2~~TRINITY_DN66123_c7_g2_i1.p1  ORF type:complete len:746 (-),score=26.81 TRINITY_DN66123_c7_g2_i1:171-2336(-)